MTPSDRSLIIALIEKAADAWASGDTSRAEVWAERAWAYADGHDFIDEEANR